MGSRNLESRLEQLEPRRILSAGGLDRGFGSGGVVTPVFPAVNAGPAALSVLTTTDGRVLATVGEPDVAPTESSLLIRYLPDGTPDNNFGKQGRVVLASAPGARAALAPDGKLVVWCTDTTVLRLNPNGTPDRHFAGGARQSYGDADSMYVAVAADASIYLLFGSYDSNTASYDFSVFHLRPDGTRDDRFGKNGSIAGVGNPGGIVVQPDGKVVVVSATETDAQLLRFTAAGQIDASFGKAGASAVKIPSLSGITVVALGRDESIYFSVQQPSGSADPNEVFRFSADGVQDAHFGKHGHVDLTMEPRAMSMQAQGSLLVGGFLDTFEIIPGSGRSDQLFSIARLSAQGSLDAHFGDNGVFAHDFPGPFGTVDAIAIQPDGRIVAGGFAQSATGLSEPVIARVLPDDSFPVGGPTVGEQLAGGVLSITGTHQSDEIDIHLKQSDPMRLVVAADETARSFPLSSIKLIRIDAGHGDDVVRMSATVSVPSMIFGGPGKDRLTGGAGRDTISGETDNDTIHGGASADSITGDSGDDILFGDSGNDLIRAGKGADTLTGSAGNDRLFVRDRTVDQAYGGKGIDVVVADKDDELFTFETILT